MVRYEDPPGAVKHIRFGKVSDQILEALKGFPGVKAIVPYKNGKKGEHPHYHIWWEGDKPVTNQTLRNRLKAASPVFAEFSGQNDWSFRNHDSWESWASYTVANLSHSVLLPYKDIETLSASSKILPLTIVSEPPLTSGKTPAVRVTKLPMREKFIQYLKSERKWSPGEQFTVHSEIGLDEMEDLVIDAATEYWEMAFTIPEGARMVRHALWVFSSDEIRKLWAAKNRAAIKKSLF